MQAHELSMMQGDPVGDTGKKSEGEKKRKVKVGRQLGVGDLVEKNEAQTA